VTGTASTSLTGALFCAEKRRPRLSGSVPVVSRKKHKMLWPCTINLHYMAIQQLTASEDFLSGSGIERIAVFIPSYRERHIFELPVYP
jgi:hypothetical protein